LLLKRSSKAAKDLERAKERRPTSIWAGSPAEQYQNMGKPTPFDDFIAVDSGQADRIKIKIILVDRLRGCLSVLWSSG